MSYRRCLFVLGLIAGIATVGWAEDFRQWSDVTGKFTVQARFLRVDGETVILEREDGVKVGIEIHKLSPQDRQYLQELTSVNPFKVLGEPPKASDSTLFQPLFINQVGTVVIDWGHVRPIPVNPTVGWQLTVTPREAVTIPAKVIGLPPKLDFFEKVSGLIVNSTSKTALVQCTTNRPGNPITTNRLILCNLEIGVLGAILISRNETALSVYPARFGDRQYFLLQQNEFGFGNRATLTIAGYPPVASSAKKESAISLSSFSRQLSWAPYEKESGLARDVKWADFADERTLITCSGTGLILIWNLGNMQPEASLQTTMGLVPAISPDGHWLAFATRDQIGILDIRKREIIALQNAPREQIFPVLAFSPTGKKLASLINHRNIQIWDVASGKLEADFTLPSGIEFQGKLVFPHDDFVLGGNRYLFHWKSQLFLWDYDNIEAACSLGDVTCAVVTKKRSGTADHLELVTAHIPHAAAQKVLDLALHNPETFAFHKGMPVKLDLSAIPEDAREKVRHTLTQRLKEMGCEVQEEARVTLAAGVGGPKERTVSYWHSGDYKVKEYTLWIRILVDGQVLWETSAGGVPFILLLKPGENVGDKLRELTAKPNYQWFETVTLPQYLQHVPTKGSVALGRGPLTIEPFKGTRL